MENETRILFIAGYVRSGSTLLSLLLGDLAGYFSVGEMAAMVYGPDTSLQDLCMCGRTYRECDFWLAVWESAFPGIGQETRDDLSAQLRREAVSRSRFSRGGPVLSGARAERARQQMSRLYEAAATTSGSHTLVDSSKTPAHGFMIRAAGLDSLKVVHLVRNPCAVAFSQSRVKERTEKGADRGFLPRRSLLRSILGWTKANLLAERLARTSSGSTRIRYEDLVAHPEEALGVVVNLNRESSTGEGAGSPKPRQVESQHVRHDVAGNPSKFAWARGGRAIVADEEWTTAMPAYARRLVMICTYPLMRRYGYLPKASA